MKNRSLPVEEARIRRLLAVGCLVPEHSHSSGAPDLVIEVRKPERTQAFDFRHSTEYILDLRSCNKTCPATRCVITLNIAVIRTEYPWPRLFSPTPCGI
jgi:hypothetical protein